MTIGQTTSDSRWRFSSSPIRGTDAKCVTLTADELDDGLLQHVFHWRLFRSPLPAYDQPRLAVVIAVSRISAQIQMNQMHCHGDRSNKLQRGDTEENISLSLFVCFHNFYMNDDGRHFVETGTIKAQNFITSVLLYCSSFLTFKLKI